MRVMAGAAGGDAELAMNAQGSPIYLGGMAFATGLRVVDIRQGQAFFRIEREAAWAVNIMAIDARSGLRQRVA